MDKASVFPRRQLSLLKQKIKIVLSPCAVLRLALTANRLGRMKGSCKSWLQMPAQTGVMLCLHVCTPNSLLTVFYIVVVLMKQLARNSPDKLVSQRPKRISLLSRFLCPSLSASCSPLLWTQLKITHKSVTYRAPSAPESCGRCNLKLSFETKTASFWACCIGKI